MTTIMTTTIVSVLTYALLRSIEVLARGLIGWYREDKEKEIEQLVELIEGYKRMLDENAEDKKAVSK